MLKPGKNCFVAIGFAAALLSGCAYHVVIPSAAHEKITRTETRRAPARPAPFKEYKSFIGTLSGMPGAWNIAEDASTTPFHGVLTLSGARDSTRSAVLYETGFSPGAFQKKDIENALAYLFKVDAVDSARPPSGFEGFKVLLPPNESSHCGLLLFTDTGLVYLHLRGIPEPGLKGCRAGGLSFDTGGAVTGNPWNQAHRRPFLAALINTIGLKALEDTAYRDAERRFQQAFALDSTAPEYLVNLAVIHALRGDPAGGIDLLLRYPRLLESSGQLCGLLGSFYEETYRYPEARDWALKALGKDPDNREWLINLSDALWGMGEKVQSKNVLLRPFAEKADFRLASYLATTHLGLEEFEEALAVLDRAHALSAPTAKSTAYVLRAYLGLKRCEDGLDFIRKLDTSFSQTGENLFLKAACEFNLKLYRQAGESVDLSLRLDPFNREAQELQTQIAALLGDRSNQLLRAPLPPLFTTLDPDQARKMPGDSSMDSRLTGYPIIMIAQQVVREWTPRSRWKQTRRLFFLVPDGSRLIRFSELIFSLNPSYERFHVNRLRIYDSAWTCFHEGGLADYYITKNPATDLHPENLLAHIGLKRRPGRMFVELLITEEAQLPGDEFPYVRFEHAAGYPVLNSRFEFLHPPNNLLITPFGDVRFDTLPDRLVLTMPTTAFPPDGLFSPDADAYGSGFSASPFATWRETGLRYLRELKNAGIDIPRIPPMVRERASVIAARASVENPVLALFRYVRDSIRYDNHEFSLQAGIPDSSPAVLIRRYGDCKGQALLLAQMLRARGIEANPCLVNLLRAGEAGQPHVNQFNHMIVHVPWQRNLGPYFLDPTEKFSAFRRIPLGLEGHNTLVLDPAEPRLVSIPEIDSSSEHSVSVFHDLEIKNDGAASGRDSLTLQGKAAAEFRERLGAWSAAAKQQNMLGWLASGYSAFNEVSFRILDEKDPDAPLTLVLRYHGRLLKMDTAQSFDYFPKLELSFLRLPDADHRNCPFYFPHEITVESNWTYHLPAGFRWKSLSLARQLEQEYLHWQLSIQQNQPRTIILRQQWRIEPFLADPDQYRRLRADWDPIFQRCGLRLAISRL